MLPAADAQVVRRHTGAHLGNEDLKVLVLPVTLTVFTVAGVVAERQARPTLARLILLGGWLIAGSGLTLVAKEGRSWGLAGYLQNLVAFLGLCLIPFSASYWLNWWLDRRGANGVIHLGATVTLSLLSIVPTGLLLGPYWAVFLNSTLRWHHVEYP